MRLKPSEGILLDKESLLSDKKQVTPHCVGKLCGAKDLVVLISRNSSLLLSLAYLIPVRDTLFVENNHQQKNEPRRA